MLPLLALTGCENNDNSRKAPGDQLPPPTQSGKYTFGCLVNGEVMIPNNTNYMSAVYQGGGIQIGGRMEINSISNRVTLIAIDPIQTNQTYSLTDKALFIKRIEDNTSCYYDYENTFDGWIKFSKIDRTNYIVSGTFEYSTVNEDCDTIRVTDGRFDLPYIP